jgi:hypothetical protein
MGSLTLWHSLPSFAYIGFYQIPIVPSPYIHIVSLCFLCDKHFGMHSGFDAGDIPSLHPSYIAVHKSPRPTMELQKW